MLKGKRNHYTYDEEVQMKIYVKKYSGNPENISYWARAKNSNAFPKHSANSLRAHWRILEDNDKTVRANRVNVPKGVINAPNPINLPPVPQILLPPISPPDENLNLADFEYNQSPQSLKENENHLQSKLSPTPITERRLKTHEKSQLFSPLSPTETPNYFYTSARPKVKPHVCLPTSHLSPDEIDEKLAILVSRCSQLSGKKLSTETVLSVLIKFNGVASQTLKFFTNN